MPNGPGFGVITSGANDASSPDVLPCCDGGGGYPASAYFTGNQTPQQTSYWCGPAAVHEALDSMGVDLSQSTLASQLGTTTDGAGWSNSGGPVPTVLNNHQSRNYYVSQAVTSDGSSAVSTYEEDLEADIYAIGAPLVGDAYEVVGGPHLVGHPNENIFHWFDIRGYASSGASTMYEDSVHNATSVSWYAGVPAYSTMSSSTIVTILLGRGYVW